VIVACYEKKLSSAIGFKGILKKLWILLAVGLAGLLDKSLHLPQIARSMVCCFYICNEAISIIENGTKLGIPFPKKLLNYILAAKRKNDEEVKNDE
jgi:toxin secretion/phage lysis holin